jgi:(p)ppGpp synthase/HD superfamily hydrolase
MAQTNRLVKRLERWVCPHPEKLLGLQSALVDGPDYGRAHIHFMESNGASGPVDQPLSSRDKLISLLRKNKYKEIDLVREALECLRETLPAEQQEKNLRIAHQLAKWKVSSNVIAAALLINCPEKKIKIKKMREILENRDKLSGMECDYSQPSQIQYFRNLLLLSAQNHEVLLLLAAEDLIGLEELVNRRKGNLDLFATPSAKKAEREREERHVLLQKQANRAFFVTSWLLKFFTYEKKGGTLEDLSLLHLEPEKYHEVEEQYQIKTGMSRADSMSRLKSIAEDLNLLLNMHDHVNQIRFRVKRVASMAQKGSSTDVNGIRIILDTEKIGDCYSAYDLIRNDYLMESIGWKEMDSEYDDYIANPKKNGYRSLHVVFRDTSGYTVEIQIRTKEMDQVAEFGTASHADYKTGEEIVPIADKGIPVAQQRFDAKVNNMRQSGIYYIYQNDGQIVRLKTGSAKTPPTILDFAFAQDLRTGIYAEGGSINGKRVAIGSPLESGQRVTVRASRSTPVSVAGRAKKVSTPFARAILLAGAKGEINLQSVLNEAHLENRGKQLFQGFLISFAQELSAYDDLFPAKPALRFSMERLLDRTAYSNEKEFYLTIALLSQTDEFFGEIRKHLLQNLSLVSSQTTGRVTNIQIFTTTKQHGVLLNAHKLLEKHEIKLRSIQQQPVPGSDYGMLNFRVVASKDQLEKFKADIENLYIGVLPPQAQYGNVLKLDIKVAKNNPPLGEILRVIVDVNANIKYTSIPEASRKEDLIYSFRIQLPDGTSKKKAMDRIEKRLKQVRGVRNKIRIR